MPAPPLDEPWPDLPSTSALSALQQAWMDELWGSFVAGPFYVGAWTVDFGQRQYAGHTALYHEGYLMLLGDDVRCLGFPLTLVLAETPGLRPSGQLVDPGDALTPVVRMHWNAPPPRDSLYSAHTSIGCADSAGSDHAFLPILAWPDPSEAITLQTPLCDGARYDQPCAPGAGGVDLSARRGVPSLTEALELFAWMHHDRDLSAPVGEERTALAEGSLRLQVVDLQVGSGEGRAVVRATVVPHGGVPLQSVPGPNMGLYAWTQHRATYESALRLDPAPPGFVLGEPVLVRRERQQCISPPTRWVGLPRWEDPAVGCRAF
ncbi:MAG: hypothetical protein H6739_42490 [Alphaproteobacteria bacterium]|nr:hypothetical protein [Alphaproteobacteria bacterium]